MLQCCNTCGIKDSSVRLNVALAAVEDCYIRFLIANNVVDDGVGCLWLKQRTSTVADNYKLLLNPCSHDNSNKLPRAVMPRKNERKKGAAKGWMERSAETTNIRSRTKG